MNKFTVNDQKYYSNRGGVVRQKHFCPLLKKCTVTSIIKSSISAKWNTICVYNKQYNYNCHFILNIHYQICHMSSSLVDDTSSSSCCLLKPRWVRKTKCSIILAPMFRIRASQASAKMIDPYACKASVLRDVLLVWVSPWNKYTMQTLNVSVTVFIVCFPSLLTHYIISKANGAEGNEGKVETLSKCPAFSVTEEERGDD